MKRELFEETGLKALDVKYLFDYNYWHQRHKVFLVKAKGKIKLNWEIVNYGFLGKVDKDEIGKSTQIILSKYFDRKGF